MQALLPWIRSSARPHDLAAVLAMLLLVQHCSWRDELIPEALLAAKASSRPLIVASNKEAAFRSAPDLSCIVLIIAATRASDVVIRTMLRLICGHSRSRKHQANPGCRFAPWLHPGRRTRRRSCNSRWCTRRRPARFRHQAWDLRTHGSRCWPKSEPSSRTHRGCQPRTERTGSWLHSLASHITCR